MLDSKPAALCVSPPAPPSQGLWRRAWLVVAIFGCLAALGVTTSVQATTTAVTISVDASANRHAINPEIYGVNYATTAQLQDLNAPVHRAGGNATSRYNWQANASNRGSDWFFES